MAPSGVDLIPGASQAFVLSDVERDAARQAGELPLILAGFGTTDPDLPGAMRPRQACLVRKSFSLHFIFGSAELFTEGWGELPGALSALG